MTGESRFCKNCKRDVSAANFSLHEAHCMRFLTLCPECDEPVAQKDMEDHQTEAHKQIRCRLCHQSMQQYQLEYHENKECQKRAMKCTICDLEMPFNKLQEHLDTCASRTERCQECNKYIMYKDQHKHKEICPNSGLSYHKDLDFQTSEASTNATVIRPIGTGGNLCQKCSKLYPDDQYSQHLNKCNAAHKLTKVLAGQSASSLISAPPRSSSSLAPSSSSENAMAWKDVRPKGKEREQPLTSKPLKNKKIGFLSPTRGGCSTSPQALKDTQSFDMLVTCDHCDILLPLPTLRKHEIKCLHWTTLQNARMNQKSSHGEKGDSFYSIRD
ncbi:XIAP-associated factor 1 [Chiroxiphia lanceolata]|uniref:XIAP-associated factor 1 n=1 Tax=Chiroxiphia lanceolata TaxID=296741 RepID=UPI0013CE5259|nr:XIAP-associated factor 1 [Chiroxiphia lanceolata]XP_032563264.1 XIAP-associated factor 1 [Chiroxiphia lanceolata]